jgi:hypothetical protein
MEEKNYPITEEQKKGIEFISRAMSKKFKFIKSIELFHNYADYENLLFVDVIMDYAEFAKTYNYYTKKLTYRGRTRSSSLSAYMSRDEKSWSEPTEEDVYNEIRAIRNDIESRLVAYYESLPPEYQATYVSSWGDTQVRGLSISEYIDVE